MDWKKYWDDNASINIDNEIDQVQRKDIESTLLTVKHIIKVLDIDQTDTVLDVCCGNGILTELISKKVSRVVGVDQSKILIETALKNHKELNISYRVGSALALKQVFKRDVFDKIYLQFSFQYFDKKEGRRVVRQLLRCLKSNGKIFIGDIPNKDKFSVYYDSPVKKLRFFKGKMFNKNEMGKFWEVSELDKICKKLGVKGTYLAQPKELPYSHYRFDYLIEN